MSKAAELIYGQIHQHLIESHRKRDQVIAFYVALLSAFYLGREHLGDSAPVVIIALFLVGCVFALVIIVYRTWHVRLMGATTVFQRRILEGCVALQICEEEWRYYNGPIRTRPELMNPFASVEAAMFVAFSLVLALVADEALRAVVASAPDLWMRILAAVVTVVALQYIAANMVFRAQQFPESDWWFRWLRAEDPRSS